MLNFKNILPLRFSIMNMFEMYDLLISIYFGHFKIAIILIFMGATILSCCSMYILLSDDKHQYVHDNSKECTGNL